MYSAKEHKYASKGSPDKEIIEESQPGKVERNLNTYNKRSRFLQNAIQLTIVVLDGIKRLKLVKILEHSPLTVELTPLTIWISRSQL